MKRRTRLITLLAVLLVLALGLVACTPATTAPTTTAPTTTAPTTAAPTEPGEASITDGIFESRFTPEGYSEFVSYFNFYSSGIFYLSTFNGGQFMAGYYEVKEMEVEYMPDPEDEEKKATATTAVVLTKLDGSAYATLAYVDGIIYDLPALYNHDFVHIPDSDHSPADENGIAIIEFMLGDDEYSLVRLMHNGTFQDTIGAMVEGTWEQNGNVYTLTDEFSGDEYTLTLNPDGDTAEYKGLDGSTQTLNLIKESPTVATFWGTNEEAAYGVMEIEIVLREDGTASLVAYYAGTENKQEGTWVLAENRMTMTLSIGGVDYVAPLDVESRTFAFDFETSDGAKDIIVSLTTAPKVTYTFVGESNANVIMECYADGTAAVIYVGMGTITTGTWVMDTDSGPLPKWTVVLAETLEGTDTEMTVETDYATKFYFTFKNSSGQLEEVLALPFTALQG